jgi:hypothetical protein
MKAKTVKSAPAVNLDQNFLDAVRGPILTTWDYIAADAYQLGGRITNSGCMELVLDADRLTYAGATGKAASELVSQAIAQHGWTKVSRFLCSKIKLA